MLMRLIDRIHMDKPFLGSRRIVDALAAQDHEAGRKHVQRLMRLMGIRAIHPGPKTSKPHLQHKIYPYLLRGLKINRANQVWASDVTYRAPILRKYLLLILTKLEHVWNAFWSSEVVMNRMPAFCYEKARAEAAVTCCTLTG